MVKPQPLSCILDLLIDGIFSRWLLNLELGDRCGTLLEEVVILCRIDIFYIAHVLRMVACMGIGSTWEEC